MASMERYRLLCAAFSLGIVASCSSDSGTASNGNSKDGGGDEGGGATGSGGRTGSGGVGDGGKGNAGSGGGNAGAGGGGVTDAGSGGGNTDSGADAGPCTLAEDFTTVDDYAHPSANHTNPSQLVSAPDGVYGSGFALTAGKSTGLLRSSKDGETFTLVKADTGIGGDLARTADAWFVTGGDGSGTKRAVHRSAKGETWEVVDTVPLATGACNTGYLATTSTGKIYSAGSCDVEGWHVRVSEDGGDTWNDVGALFQLANGQPARVGAIHANAADTVYVSGNAQDSTMMPHWIVRRLATTGSFATVDDYQLMAGKPVTSPTLSGANRVYATGSADDDAGHHWIVRRLTGSAWTTIDDYTVAGATAVVASSIYEGNGVIIAIGTVTDAAGVSSVLVRRSTDDGKTWTAGTPWTYASKKSSTAVGNLVADAAGNVYAAIRGVATDDHAHWVIRKMVCER
jgi:hypothetical protein